MKKILLFLFVVVLGVVIWKRDDISQFVIQNIVFKEQHVVSDANDYYKTDNYLLFKDTNNFSPKSKEEFNDIMYTILNNGWDSFSFFCDFDYKNCINDFSNYIKYDDYIEVINNYVHPYNSFDNISITTNNFNMISLQVDHLYSDSQIKIINQKIDEFIENNIKDTMTDREKIKIFHDWVINNTKYDTVFDTNTNKATYPYHPYNAYGVFAEGSAICSGYSDAMAIFLNKIGVKNYKIASAEHIWNYVFIENSWYHLDLTWDDPVMTDGSDILIYDFFLITDDELANKKTAQHDFNYNYYLDENN